MNKYTNGPWTDIPAQASPPGYSFTVVANMEPIADIPDGDNDEANAKLIAAAPELLEALQEVIQSAENWACACEINGQGANNPAAVYVRNARQVIAKATGKA